MTTEAIRPHETGKIRVRQLTSDSLPAFDELCRRHPALMLTPRMNVEAHGLSAGVVRAWGAFADTIGGERLEGALLRFGNIAVIADPHVTCIEAFANVIDADADVAGIRGNLAAVKAVRSSLRKYRATDWEDSHFMQLLHPPLIDPQTLSYARRATPEDLNLLAPFYGAAGSMYRSRANVAGKLTDSRVFIVEEPAVGRRPARIASSALLNVEGSDAAMIGGVYTLPQARGRGYAGACVAALANDLRAGGKLPCLFYEFPIAGRVYRRLGFTDAGTWAVLYLSPFRAKKS